MSRKKKDTAKSNSLPGGTILIAAAAMVLFFAFYDVKSEPVAEGASAQEILDPTFGWYLYQTKTNSFFQVKYPYSWHASRGTDFVGEENLYVQSPDLKTTIKISARTNEKYKDFDSFLKEVSAFNGARIGYQLLKEDKSIWDGRAAARREEHWAGEKTNTITTYVFSGQYIVQLQTDFAGSDFLTSENRAFHNLVADTLKFVN